MKDNKDSIYSTISKVGPMTQVEGGLIALSPFNSYPLDGFQDEKAFKGSELFLQSISREASRWYTKFPDCCDNHKRLAFIPTFDKKNYNFIPAQILNNVKYFSHALETFINLENGMSEIKDYLDYLIESFGRPNIGGHIFINSIKHFIENGSIKNSEFTDDQRLELLEHLEPSKETLPDLNERDLATLYVTFEKWINAMPNIGKFKDIKKNLRGKVPMNFFVMEPKHNKYLQRTSFKMRSKKELLKFLLTLTNDLISISKTEINKESYGKDKLINAAEERLRIKQEKLVNDNHTDSEISYLSLVETWISNIIEFYQVLDSCLDKEQLNFNKTNPELNIKIYESILENIYKYGQNLEKFESLYQKFDEEGFRDFFLPHLNLVSTSLTASGETFNKKGKTDILIQNNFGINVFIAECKLWKGESHLLEAVDQLLERYVTWRDEKVALIIFNKDMKNFSSLVSKATEKLKNHKLFKTYDGERYETSFKYVFTHPNDKDRKILLELMIFNCK